MARIVFRWRSLCASMAILGAVVPGWQQVMGNEKDVAAVLAKFSEEWPEDRIPYRTAEDQTTWKTYALSMRQLVAMGDAAVPGLTKACDSASHQERALAARVLGYLQAESAVPQLITMLGDKNATVALNAADALGQIQNSEGLAALKVAQTKEKRGDVLLHIGKALARQTPLEDDVVEQVLKITPKSVNSAAVGQPAPDFTLKDSTGKTWKLSDFRGKKSVVLAFIYGDG